MHGDPSDALATREGAAKRSQGHVQAGLLSREIREYGDTDAVGCGRQHRRQR